MVCIIATNDALHELKRQNENARFDGYVIPFPLHRSTVVAISAYAWRVAAVANLLSC